MLLDVDLSYVNGVLTTSKSVAIGGSLTVGGTSVTTPAIPLPTDQGFTSWAYDPSFASTGQLAVNGTLYLSKVQIRSATTISKVWWLPSAAGATPTAGQSFAALISSAGTVLSSASADANVTGSAGSPQFVTLAAAQAVSAGFVWVALLFNAATPPTLLRTNGAFTATNNANLTAAAYRYATNGTALTALPASITPASNALGPSLWVAVS